MAQLKQDEWPQDGEPTTSEEEGARFKREGANPPGKPSGRTTDEMNRAAHESVVGNVEPDRDED